MYSSAQSLQEESETMRNDSFSGPKRTFGTITLARVPAVRDLRVARGSCPRAAPVDRSTGQPDLAATPLLLPIDGLRLGRQLPRAAHASANRRPTVTDSTPRDVGVTHLEQALATSQRQLGVARNRVETLVKRDLRLKRRFLQLARKEAEVRHVAYHDELTGLPNRSLLLDRFNQAVAQGARKAKRVALLFLDLDGFKSVNDELGHGAGDALLQQVAGRLTACIRAGDTACRYGGDEFVIMLPEIDGQESAAAVAEKIRGRLSAPYLVGGGTVTVTASIGTAVYPVDGQDYEALLQQSDIRMYRAKARSGAEPRPLAATDKHPLLDAIE
jgi:diguanylate cyclase (GGDEF)-like protein